MANIGRDNVEVLVIPEGCHMGRHRVTERNVVYYTGIGSGNTSYFSVTEFRAMCEGPILSAIIHQSYGTTHDYLSIGQLCRLTGASLICDNIEYIYDPID